MSNVKNNHVSALTIGSTTIAAGATAKVPDWEVQQNSNAVKAWLDAGVIEETNAKAKTPAVPPVVPPAVPPAIPGLPAAAIPGLPAPVDPELTEKQVIIDKLAAIGITKTTKSKLDSLKAQLAAAEADQG